jgi:Coenzyme PQQ synthesis protein D (PqqD)
MFRISDSIRRTETQDGGILLDVHHGQMFCLNIVGAKILELMQRGYDESRIAEQISRDYGANMEVVRADVTEFIENLHKHHILQLARPGNVL